MQLTSLPEKSQRQDAKFRRKGKPSHYLVAQGQVAGLQPSRQVVWQPMFNRALCMSCNVFSSSNEKSAFDRLNLALLASSATGLIFLSFYSRRFYVLGVAVSWVSGPSWLLSRLFCWLLGSRAPASAAPTPLSFHPPRAHTNDWNEIGDFTSKRKKLAKK